MEIEKQQSLLGITSTALALYSVAVTFSIFLIVGLTESMSPGYLESNHYVDRMLAVGFFFSIFINLVGLAIGAVSLFQKNGTRIFKFIGATINFLMLFSIVFLLFLGIYEKQISELLGF